MCMILLSNIQRLHPLRQLPYPLPFLLHRPLHQRPDPLRRQVWEYVRVLGQGEEAAGAGGEGGVGGEGEEVEDVEMELFGEEVEGERETSGIGHRERNEKPLLLLVQPIREILFNMASAPASMKGEI